ncbi:MAG: DUF86 domain-containing protein [Candidatus Nanohaloarchaea archaeon]|nr:DUF86 domain-containing protein [Candidatus Nanohaloarchaea archaeon]
MVEIDKERKERYLEKLEKLDERTGNIESWLKGVDEKDFLEDDKTRLSVYKAFQEAVEAVTDICAMFVSDSGRNMGDDYQNISKVSGELFSESIERSLKDANGLRNRLVHEYNMLEESTSYEAINRIVADLETFHEEVSQWIRNS